MATCGFRLRPINGTRASGGKFAIVRAGNIPFVIITRTKGRGTCMQITSKRRRSIDHFSMNNGGVRGKLGKFMCNRENM